MSPPALFQAVEAVVVMTDPATDGLRNLLQDVAAFVADYVVLGEHERVAITLWIAHTYAIDAAVATPYLHITSAEKASGKTRTLEVLNALCRKPHLTTNISVSALFRLAAQEQPTLLIDEVDGIFYEKGGDKEELRSLLCGGYIRGASAIRVGGNNRDEVQHFETFCPKVLAGLREIPDTLASRSIRIGLKKKTKGEPVERFRRRDVAPLKEALCARLDEWSAGPVIDRLREARPFLPDELGDRAADVWEPLLAIADEAGDDWGRIARQAACVLMREPDGEQQSFGVQLLASIRDVFADKENPDSLATAALLDLLRQMEEAPWDAYGHGKGLDALSLAKLLKLYGIKSENLRDEEGKQQKSYRRSGFADAWERHLPAHTLEHASHPSHPSHPAIHAENARPVSVASPSQKSQDDPSCDGSDDLCYGSDDLCYGKDDPANPHGYSDATDATDATDIPGYEGTPAACGIDGHTTWTTHMGLIRCRTCQPPAISTAEQLPL